MAWHSSGIRWTCRALLVAVAVALGPGSAAADAACVSATPLQREYFDLPLDADGSSGHYAPEITSVVVGLGSDCVLTVTPVLANRPGALTLHDGVYVFIDTDGQPGTGAIDTMATGLGYGMGSDRAVKRMYDEGGVPIAGTYNPADGWFSFTGPPLPASGAGGFAARVDDLGIAPATTIRLWVTSRTSWLGWSSYDDAPNPDMAQRFDFRVDYSTVAPPSSPTSQLPPTAPPAPTASPTPTPTPVPDAAVLVAPKRLTLARLLRGFRITLRLAQPAKSVTAAVTAKLHGSSVTVATAQRRSVPAGNLRLSLKASKRARARMRGIRRATLTLRARITPPAGAPLIRTAPIAFIRAG